MSRFTFAGNWPCRAIVFVNPLTTLTSASREYFDGVPLLAKLIVIRLLVVIGHFALPMSPGKQATGLVTRLTNEKVEKLRNNARRAIASRFLLLSPPASPNC